MLYSVPGDCCVDLTYEPLNSKSVTCNSDHIFIVEQSPAGGIHIHTWTGLHIQNISKRQLGLQENDWIWKIGYSTKVQMLQLAVGDYHLSRDNASVISLCAYRVCSSYGHL